MLNQWMCSQTYFPELLGTLCIVRAHPALAWVLSAAKAMLHPETAAKVHVLQGDPVQVLLARHTSSSL